MTVSFSAEGPLYPRFGQLLTKMELDDWIGTESIERYKLEPSDMDADRINSTLETVKTNPFAAFAFDATYSFLVAANNLMHKGLEAAKRLLTFNLDVIKVGYYYGSILLYRNAIIAILPAALSHLPEMQIQAHKNQIETIPLVCDGFRPLAADVLQSIPKLWTPQQTQILANSGISIDDATWRSGQ
eukprot:Skav212964  [mRNA]  locus=scaffold1345:18357:27206:+ [translate_table: standard]